MTKNMIDFKIRVASLHFFQSTGSHLPNYTIQLHTALKLNPKCGGDIFSDDVFKKLQMLRGRP